jgi:hypothetical protein
MELELRTLLIMLIVCLAILLVLVGYIVICYAKDKKYSLNIAKKIDEVEARVDEIIFDSSERGAYLPSDDVKKEMNRNNWY